MSLRLQYADVEEYLRAFPAEADYRSLFQLVLAGIETLRQNSTDGHVIENAHFITDAQARFLRLLLESRPESLEFFKDEITHSSQTGQL